MATHSLFPTLVFQKDLSPLRATRLNRDLLSDIRILEKIDNDGIKWSKENYIGGYTSYSSITDLHLRHSPFMELRKLIDRQVQNYIRHLEVDLKNRKVEMTTCWVNVMPPRVHHSLHLHPLCFISGTYYVQVPAKSGPLILEDPRMGLYMAAPPRRDKARSLNPYFYSLQPQQGRLFLWESWLRHEVPTNKGKGTRISISFNYEWV